MEKGVLVVNKYESQEVISYEVFSIEEDSR